MMSLYDNRLYMATAREEAALCRDCLFSECRPTAQGCQLRAHQALERRKVRPESYHWRGCEFETVASLAAASGSNYDKLLYRLNQGGGVERAVRLAGGREPE